jgi:hypothetical protein
VSQSRSNTSWRRWGLVAACVAAVLVASVLRPPAVLGADAGGVAVDKWLHGIGYALLAAVVAAVAALGLAVEAVQAPLAYRSSSVADAAANAAGALVGVAAAWLLARVR